MSEPSLMTNLWNSQFWYLVWGMPIFVITAFVLQQIIAKRQSEEYWRRTYKYTNPEAFKKSPEVQRRKEKRIGRWLGIMEGQIAEARAHRDDARTALKVAQDATTAKAAIAAAAAARASAEKAALAAHAAAASRKNLPNQALPEAERELARASMRPRGPRPEGMQGGGPRPEGMQGRGPRPEGMQGRGPRPEGMQGRGPRPEGMQGRGPRPEGMQGRGPRPEGMQGPGPRPEGMGPGGPAGPRPGGGGGRPRDEAKATGQISTGSLIVEMSPEMEARQQRRRDLNAKDIVTTATAFAKEADEAATQAEAVAARWKQSQAAD